MLTNANPSFGECFLSLKGVDRTSNDSFIIKMVVLVLRGINLGSKDGSQPIVHRQRGTLSMTNGEIYNYAYLRNRYKNSEWGNPIRL